MGRPGLLHHRKFRRLVAIIGDDALALGSLELMWSQAYESADPYLGDSTDVELAARWKGEAGKLTQAFLNAGGNGRGGFIDEVPDRPGYYEIHDLYDNAPEYVKKRLIRDLDRKKKGKTISELRAEAGKKSGEARGAQVAENGEEWEQPGTSGEQTAANGRTPSPALPKDLKKRNVRSATRKRTPYPDEFKAFWKTYPRPVQKTVAFEAWKRVVAGDPPDDVIRAAQEYADRCAKERTEEKYILHPATFLNKDRWKDYCFEEANP